MLSRSHPFKVEDSQRRRSPPGALLMTEQDAKAAQMS